MAGWRQQQVASAGLVSAAAACWLLQDGGARWTLEGAAGLAAK